MRPTSMREITFGAQMEGNTPGQLRPVRDLPASLLSSWRTILAESANNHLQDPTPI